MRREPTSAFCRSEGATAARRYPARMADFTRDECLAFLRAWPSRLAHVATVRPDGTTLTVPVWYRVDEADDLLIWSGTQRKWVQRLQRSGHLSLSVAEDGFPLRGVMAAGPAEVLEEDAFEVLAERDRIIRRYVLAPAVDAYTASRDEYRAIIRVRLERLSGWTFAP